MPSVLLCGLALVAFSTHAYELEFNDRSMSGFIDTTLSAGVAVTTRNVNPLNAAPSGRGTIFSTSGSLYSAPLSSISDIGFDMKTDWGNAGLFSRVGYLYDVEIRDGSNRCGNCSGSTPQGTLNGVPDQARDEYNKWTLYDLFGFTNFTIGGHATTYRIGRQIINWGESNLISGGISQMINPADLAKTTTPGSEVKERMLPQAMHYINFEIDENTSLETYYVWKWERSEFFPVGTLFSPFDIIGAGFNPDLSPGFSHQGTVEPDSGGQWGVALHHIFEKYDYIDLGLYWVRSHAFNPYIQAHFTPILGYREIWAEDQDTYGISLNGEVGSTGISFQTEFNLKEDFYDTRECANSFGLRGTTGCEIGNSDVYTWLGSLTYSIGGGPFGADKQSYILDAVLVKIEGQSRGDATDKTDARLNYSSPGVDQLDRILSDFAWGYTFVMALEYNNLFWNLNVKPAFVWVHHVEGYTPFNSSALVENQRTAKVAVTFDYQSQMSLELAATWWPGLEGTWSDRDNVSAIFKYSF